MDLKSGRYSPDLFSQISGYKKATEKKIGAKAGGEFRSIAHETPKMTPKATDKTQEEMMIPPRLGPITKSPTEKDDDNPKKNPLDPHYMHLPKGYHYKDPSDPHNMRWPPPKKS